jgi:RNA polymerase sporulation-specific sigma factor
MLSAFLLLLVNTAFWSLKVGSSGGSFPRKLSSEEELKCLQAIAGGNTAAREKLIEHNMRLVAHICKKYYSREDAEDLISIGTIGLIKAIDSYKLSAGTKLATYAARCIENEILMQLRKDRKRQGDVSLNDEFDSDGDGSVPMIDTLAAPDDLIDSIALSADCERLQPVLGDVLTDRERELITMRYGIDGKRPRTQSEIGCALNISRSYVSRIEKRAIEKLRECF